MTRWNKVPPRTTSPADQPSTEAGRRLIADLWGAEPEGEIAKTAAQEQWWSGAIQAIEAEARQSSEARIAQLTEEKDAQIAALKQQLSGAYSASRDENGVCRWCGVTETHALNCPVAGRNLAFQGCLHDARIASEAVAAERERLTFDRIYPEWRKYQEVALANGSGFTEDQMTGAAALLGWLCNRYLAPSPADSEETSDAT